MRIVLLTRQLLSLLQVLGVVLLQILFAIVALAIPLGLGVATVRLGSAAFQELWGNGFATSGAYQARER